MIFRHHRPGDRIDLRLPLLMLVLASTAIPVEWRSPTDAVWSLGVYPLDVLTNVLGYLAVGIVLADLGPFRALGAAFIVSFAAETAQFAMMHRDPSIVDVLANLVGAGLGVAGASRWKVHVPAPAVSRRTSQIAATLSVLVGLGVWLTSGDAINTRGLTSPGKLEGHWKLDERAGDVAADSSGNGLNGRFSRHPLSVMDADRPAASFDGADDYVDLGHSSSLRLAGSMTISGWVHAVGFRDDDAVIFSSRDDSGSGYGYQLDASTGRGPRRIALKVVDECGRRMALFGATPFVADRWYHVAGVYDADTPAMNVYLNGTIDNGIRVGQVAGAQHPSRSRVYIGRRGGRDGHGFGGFIRDVRIYSRALTMAEIVRDMKRDAADGMVAGGSANETAIGKDVRGVERSGRHANVPAACAIASDREDARTPIAAASLGLLVATACLGLWPSAGVPVTLALSVAAGFVLLHTASPTLPSINLCVFPATTLTAAVSLLVSVRPQA